MYKLKLSQELLLRNYGMDYETQIVPIGVHTVFSEDEEDLTFFFIYENTMYGMKFKFDKTEINIQFVSECQKFKNLNNMNQSDFILLDEKKLTFSIFFDTLELAELNTVSKETFVERLQIKKETVCFMKDVEILNNAGLTTKTMQQVVKTY